MLALDSSLFIPLLLIFFPFSCLSDFPDCCAALGWGNLQKIIPVNGHSEINPKKHGGSTNSCTIFSDFLSAVITNQKVYFNNVCIMVPLMGPWWEVKVLFFYCASLLFLWISCATAYFPFLLLFPIDNILFSSPSLPHLTILYPHLLFFSCDIFDGLLVAAEILGVV